jgi:hypothetical protein
MTYRQVVSIRDMVGSGYNPNLPIIEPIIEISLIHSNSKFSLLDWYGLLFLLWL